MSDTIRNLLAAASEIAARREARAAWVRATSAQWREAQRAMDERLTAIVEQVSEEEFERLFDEEVEPRSSVRGTEREVQKVDAFRKPLKDAAERDLWPRELYFNAV